MLTIFFTIGIFESFFLAFLAFFKKHRTVNNTILAIELLILGINILFSFFESYNHDHYFAYPWMINISSPLVMLHGPMLWFYTKSLTSLRFYFKPIYLIHFIPYFIILIYHVFAFYIHTPAEKVALAQSESFVKTFLYNFLLAFMILTIFSYLISCILLIKKHEKNIRNIFSHIENIDLNWLKVVIYGTIFTFFITYIVIISNEIYHFTTFKNSEAIGYCLASFLILVLGIYGIKQTQIFTSLGNPVTESFTSVENIAEEQSVTDLKKIMIEKKPYLDPELNISRLSEHTGLTVTQLSSLLNNTLQVTFFDFINQYRINEFKVQVVNPENKNLTLLGIGLNCGFNSKATFNRVFKNHMNITPKEYKDHLQKSETYQK